MPKISAAMLTYNREQLVGEAIESVLAQTFRDFEFIIIDNGSGDRSGAIADEYAARDGRIRVIHRARGNIGSGRNAGLDAARGEYIAFVDDDDRCEPDFLEFLHALATDNEADVSICGASDRACGETRMYSAEEAVIELLRRKRFNVQFPTKLIRRRLFDGLRFSESARYDDIELMPRILAGANRVAYRGLPKYTFRRHGGNNSAWTTNHSLLDADTLNEYLRVYRDRTEWLTKRFPNSAAAWRYFEWSFHISMLEKVLRLGLTDCGKIADGLERTLAAHGAEFLNSPHIRDFESMWMKRYVGNTQAG
ncbi:MAG: glycosyltransferase [Clostridiales Family XIII bacterium]|jgi:glycosyltransferase involved in cell wall biosynthesis|nr:glycosyltransferase [Clostridiales Family XIII bacterium]